MKNILKTVLKVLGGIWFLSAVLGIIALLTSGGVGSHVESIVVSVLMLLIGGVGLLPFRKIKRKILKINVQNNTSELLPTGNTFEEQVKIDLQKALEYQKNSPNPKFHRTDKEEDLAFNFSQKYNTTIEAMEERINETVSKIKYTSVKKIPIEQIQAEIFSCREAISAFTDMKKFCYSHGKGGSIYFQDRWEFCHNSKNPQFSFIDKTVERLRTLEEQKEAAR